MSAHQHLTRWADPVARLQRAFESDEFTLFAQPILAFAGPERYPMAEALVRLREEQKTLLPPNEFLPALEHFGMLPQLDRWVVSNALRVLAGGGRIKALTVNVSGQTLDDADFPAFVKEHLSACRLSSESLLFEIDESDTLKRLDAAVRFADAYHQLGGRVIVDAFGRRSVSFAAIRALRADFVKVDGSIVRKLLSSALAGAKMQAIVRMSATIGYAVVADFVEGEDILARARDLGAGFAQGLGVRVPLPIATLARDG